MVGALLAKGDLPYIGEVALAVVGTLSVKNDLPYIGEWRLLWLGPYLQRMTSLS